MDGWCQVSVGTGRVLDVRISGPQGGMPLVFHHGTPGAGTEQRALERAAHARGLRVVSMSRPGYGGSTRHPGRTVADVVTDTAAVLADLGASSCVVGGWSGGGPHALACAAGLDGVAATLCIAGVAPADAAGLDWIAGMGEENVHEFTAARQGEGALRPFLDDLRPALRKAAPGDIVTSIASLLPEVDRAALTDEFGEDVAAGFHEALRSGVDGWLDDDLAFVAPWGFDLAAIATPVTLWQGSADLMVPFAHGQWLASQLPDASVHLLDGEGHLSIGLGAIDAMLDELLSLVQPSPASGT